MENKFLKIMVCILLVVCLFNSVKLYQIERRVDEPYGTVDELVKIQYVTGGNAVLLKRPQTITLSEEEYNNGNYDKDIYFDENYAYIRGYKDLNENTKYLVNPISYEALKAYYYATYQENMP